MEQNTRNKLRNVVTQCRKLLEDAVAQVLQGQFGIYAAGKKDEVHVDDDAKMKHLSDEDWAYRKDILDHLEHVKALGYKPTDSLAQLVREIAFTHLNRFCAYKMMEARSLIRESVSKGLKSQGFLFYLADHEDDEKRANSGQQDVAYRHFLNWLGGTLSEEIGVLFNPHDSANRLYPPQRVLDDLLDLLNDEALADIWTQDETIGWVYQYFTPKELRDQVRKESAAPRNSYELAFRNQFFTPRYVVEFLTDNTLGRIWYEMRKGDTKLKDQCRYMVRRPTEIFLKDGEQPPKDAIEGQDELSQEELLKLPVHIPHRPKKDPRDLKILDPACGSGHFLLYCFDLLLTVYEEAYEDPDLGPALQQDYPTRDALKRNVPRLILAHNLHGIDIDLRASQIAALALWLRCQRAYQEMGLKKDRPKINRSNFVCAEPMPGEPAMLKEFAGQVEPRLLGQLVEVVFDKMKLAGEAGSLLKIEEEIRTAVASAKQQWESGPVEIQRTLFERSEPKPKQKRFNLSGVSDDEFFNEAEAKVVEALRSYAEKATNGKRLQRRLFTEDAVRGFAFVDLCHKRFDAVLMNPPFGDTVPSAVPYISSVFAASKNDLYASFVRRGLELLVGQGLVGAITSRVGFFAANLKAWRESNLLGGFGSLRTVADLGHGVLDSALVEAAAYVVSRDSSASPKNNAYFATVLDASDKGKKLYEILNGADGTETSRFSPSLATIRSIPGSPLAYWLPYALEVAISEMPSLSSLGGKAAVGLQTDDDFRFIRLLWETPSGESGIHDKWVPLSKGGEYSPYFDDLHLSLNWKNGGEEIKAFVEQHYTQWSRSVRNVDLYFQSGLTYPERTTSDFSPRPLPANSIFSIKGPGIFFPSDDLRLAFLGFAYSRVCKLLLEVFVGLGDAVESGSAARDYRAGIFNSLPFPSKLAGSDLSQIVRSCVKHMQSLYRFDETSTYFCRPALAQPKSTSLNQSYHLFRSECESIWLTVLENSWQIDEMCADKCGLRGTAKAMLSENVSSHPCEYEHKTIDTDEFRRAFDKTVDGLVDEVTSITTSRHLTKKSHWANRHLELLCHKFSVHPESVIAARRRAEAVAVRDRDLLVADVCSYCCGVAFGRWDVRKAIAESDEALRDAFASVPVCSNGMLVGSDGLPTTIQPEGYPIRIDRDGILVDDPELQDDLVRHIRDVFEAVWKHRADFIEKEACEILGVKELREYFRKPGKGGFWDDHVSRYSKSRRNAPIYWLLQSSKRNYAIWLYYHRLDKDLLFKAIVNCVEPKIRLEASRLDSLRSQKSAAGDSGKAAKKIDKDIEKQEDFISELQDFEDKLRRAADLHLEPDLNDGVVLNIAPLHELVPWKQAKSYWNELLEGKYEWSSIGKQLREKGLVQ